MSLPADFWDKLYRDGNTVWDLGAPTPVLLRLLAEQRFPPGRVLVPGAGHGYDARAFARRGFDVTAVDFADEAIRHMQDLAEPDAPVAIVQADLLALPPAMGGAFDYVWDYMCFCALDPLKRPAYADAIARVLKPGGIYIALAFPVGNFTGGPPYAINADAFLFMYRARGLTLIQREQPADSIERRRGCEELLILQRNP